MSENKDKIFTVVVWADEKGITTKAEEWSCREAPTYYHVYLESERIKRRIQKGNIENPVFDVDETFRVVGKVWCWSHQVKEYEEILTERVKEELLEKSVQMTENAKVFCQKYTKFISNTNH